MGEETLVKQKKDDGWQLLIQLARAGVDVTAAAWICASDEKRWYLYIVTKIVDQAGILAAYAAIRKALSQMPDSESMSSETKVVSPSSRLGENLADLTRRKKKEFCASGSILGDMLVDWAYVYPSVVHPILGITTMTHDEVYKKVVELLSRKGHLLPNKVVLQDGSQFVAVPSGIELIDQEMVVKFVEKPNERRIIPIDEISSVQ